MNQALKTAPPREELTPEQMLDRAADAFANHNHDVAGRLCNLVIAVCPDNLKAYKLLGRIRVAQKRWTEALMVMERTVILSPGDPDVLNELGGVQYLLGQNEAAIRSFDGARQIDPALAQTHYNLAVVLQRMGRFDEALAGYERALSLRPNHADAWNNRGVILQKLGEFDSALANYRKALDCQPSHPDALLNLPLLHLLRGEYPIGWALYENRWKVPALRVYDRRFGWPVWRGNRKAVKDKSILLFAEQGNGDTIQFCRYATMVEALGARVTLAVFRPLMGLMRSLSPTLTVIDRIQSSGTHDFQCSLMSLPLAFGTLPETIPSRSRYLDPGEASRAKWAAKLGEKRRPRVGLAWAGNPLNAIDGERSIPAAQLAPLLGFNVDYHCLHKETRNAPATNGPESVIRFWGDEMADFSDTAALIEHMDVVITVETAVAHLAGALGKTVWILLPFVPDWRWQMEREDSPWYPSARLFRQARRGVWDEPVRRVAEALKAQPWLK
jgi:Tfp pilus assembly protein PilF